MGTRSRSHSPPSWLNHSLETRFIHSGQPHDSRTGAVTVPISLATTFAQHSPGVTYAGFEYSRTNNPTRAALEKCVAEAESCRFGLSFSSGCAATMTILALYKTGDHIVAGDDLYGGTRRLFTRFHDEK
mmetsp:Transcript_22562/g.3719  ORF Transcript_22562/g.3719 Transcript_22562/m.3719 type:complete len:129 (-) Transcript_22562:816-1202(-)